MPVTKYVTRYVTHWIGTITKFYIPMRVGNRVVREVVRVVTRFGNREREEIASALRRLRASPPSGSEKSIATTLSKRASTAPSSTGSAPALQTSSRSKRAQPPDGSSLGRKLVEGGVLEEGGSYRVVALRREGSPSEPWAPIVEIQGRPDLSTVVRWYNELSKHVVSTPSGPMVPTLYVHGMGIVVEPNQSPYKQIVENVAFNIFRKRPDLAEELLNLEQQNPRKAAELALKILEQGVA